MEEETQRKRPLQARGQYPSREARARFRDTHDPPVELPPFHRKERRGRGDARRAANVRVLRLPSDIERPSFVSPTRIESVHPAPVVIAEEDRQREADLKKVGPSSSQGSRSPIRPPSLAINPILPTPTNPPTHLLIPLIVRPTDPFAIAPAKPVHGDGQVRDRGAECSGGERA